MINDSTTSVHSRTNNKAVEPHSENDVNNKSRKFRWSSCFSFITKFKKSKSQKIRLSQSYEEFAPVEYPTTKSEPATIQVLQVRPCSSIPWRQQPSSSLSPPPRQAKSKRDSSMSHRHSQPADPTKYGRRPLVDPTLTPRVKPRSIKTKKQPSLLRLSLDAELLHSPDGVHDNESLYTCKTGHSSSSFTLPNQVQPYRSGTLGATRNPKLSLTFDNDVPPLPLLNIPSSNEHTRPNSQSTTTTSNSNISFADSPVSVEAVALDIDGGEKLTLKQRRQRKSPLSMPETEQLTIALKELLVNEQEEKKKQQQQRKSYQEEVWRQQLLEQSIAFSFQNKSRQEAMLTLEGKKSQGVLSLQPIVNVHDLDHHFEKDNSTGDVVRDKAQYDAIVSSSAIHKRQLSHDERRSTITISNNNRTSLRARSPSHSSANEKKVLQTQTHQQTTIEKAAAAIDEHGITNQACSTNKKTNTIGSHLSVTPETPPHHQLNAPSLISAPSTPNSIDSSVFEDYMVHERQHVALALNH
ncbi:hypothetical protein INT47_010292 [Mucor saturninus]|uniref:Uncharacterized protein n=1 Tax=Mucor saturninus TaxID=64648 RepID=A0A8H7QUC6_9FUNG|nr:hypothetical protein INT47_010292 [Mucor saturninus]